jgi:hypothetical protein
VIFIAIFAAITGVRGDAGHSTPGIFGLLAFAGMIGGIRAVWKSRDKDKKDDKSSILQ